MLSRITLSAALLMSPASLAAADTLIAGPYYPGNPGFVGNYTLICRIINYGTKEVSIKARIYKNDGTLATLHDGGCGSSLAPRQSCAFSTGVQSNFAHTCFVSIADGATVSGMLEAPGNSQQAPFFVQMVREP